jgi:hypothetical protein
MDSYTYLIIKARMAQYEDMRAKAPLRPEHTLKERIRNLFAARQAQRKPAPACRESMELKTLERIHG